MEIPGIGKVTKDDEFEWYVSEPIPVSAFEGLPCQFVIEGYDDDHDKEDFHEAIRNFLSIDRSVIRAAEAHLFDYYLDCNADLDEDDEEYLLIDSPADVWQHIDFGDMVTFSRRNRDKGIYASIESSCDWEIEHGLQIVLKNGLQVNKIGPFNGHLTHSDAYDDESLEDVIYPKRT